MLLATVVLSAAVAAAAAPTVAADPQDPPVTAPEAAPEAPVPPTEGFDFGDTPADPAPVAVPEAPAPPLATEPAEPPPGLAPAGPAPAGPAPAFQESIDSGLKAFIRGRFSRARDEFEKAYAADPQSAAAAFYLGYANYKVGEPSARMNADKQRARELFARAYQLDPNFQPVWGQKKE
jgi:hypothetical protein